MSTTLIVPGLHGSGPEHWQSWMEARVAGSVRVTQQDWVTPHLSRWSGTVRREIDQANGHVWIIAHGFGCLATAVAAADHPDKVAGIMFVAPVAPEKFGVASYLVDGKLACPSVVVTSSNDPMMGLMRAAYWADQWGSRLISLRNAGHINEDSGFGAWHEGLETFEQLRRAHSDFPLGTLDPDFTFPDRRKKRGWKRSGGTMRHLHNWHRWLYGEGKFSNYERCELSPS